MITQEQLKQVLHYDQETGFFTWRSFRNGRAVAGSLAGSLANGYLQIRLFGKSYLAHRLAWLYVHSKWPVGSLDHIDTDGFNNRISNLREATDSENGQNRQRPQVNNESGFLGVFQLKGRKNWRAQIRINRRQIYLGVFKTATEAHEAYVAAKRELHPFGML